MFKCIFKLIFAKEIKVMKLKINKASQIIIQELIESYPSESKYIYTMGSKMIRLFSFGFTIARINSSRR